MAFRTRNFHAMYLAAGSLQPKNNHVKELISSVNDNNDVFISVSLISTAIHFLVNSRPIVCKKASKNKFVLSSAGDLETSNIVFNVGATR